MGIYKYMFNSGNQAEILDYCNEKLRTLEEYDHANGTFLQDTLLAYYMNGFSVGKTAEACLSTGTPCSTASTRSKSCWEWNWTITWNI